MDHFLNTLHSSSNVMGPSGNDHHSVQHDLSPDDVSPEFNSADAPLVILI
jgi:hypothetical protein